MKNTFSLRLSKEVIRLCKIHSTKYDMCPCPIKGSAAHFIKWAIIKELEKHVPYKYLVKVMHD